MKYHFSQFKYHWQKSAVIDTGYFCFLEILDILSNYQVVTENSFFSKNIPNTFSNEIHKENN